MTNDSKLFPPRTKWESQGYRPDEYSRWLKGDWRPIAELWAELNVQPLPAGERRCAQPPYDTLPIPRADIPAGIFLSRDADEWISEDAIAIERVELPDEEGESHETAVPAIALPLYQGAMVHELNAVYQAWDAPARKWIQRRDATGSIGPKFLLAMFRHRTPAASIKVVVRDIGRSTDERSMICAVVPDAPCGNVLGVLRCGKPDVLPLGALLSSLALDWHVRRRLAGTHLNYYVLAEGSLPRRGGAALAAMSRLTASVVAPSASHGPHWLSWIAEPRVTGWRTMWAVTRAEQTRLRAMLESLALLAFGLDARDTSLMFDGIDVPSACITDRADSFNPVGFWRVDKDKDPELRHTVLTLVAFHDLQRHIEACGGDRDRGIEAFLTQNDGEGWLLPETLRLADYGLGHDDRAKEPQPVASRLGPRFYDWQLAQSPEESWRECHLHARNLLGEAEYAALIARSTTTEPSVVTKPASPARAEARAPMGGRTLFD